MKNNKFKKGDRAIYNGHSGEIIEAVSEELYKRPYTFLHDCDIGKSYDNVGYQLKADDLTEG